MQTTHQPVPDLITGRSIEQRLRKGLNILLADDSSIQLPRTLSVDREMYGVPVFVDDEELSKEYPQLKHLLLSPEEDEMFKPDEVLLPTDAKVRKIRKPSKGATSLLNFDFSDVTRVPDSMMSRIVEELELFYSKKQKGS